MLEQWQVNGLLALPKIYTFDDTISLAPGTDADYQIESADGYESFIFDVWTSRRNPKKARFQLRYQRHLVIARLCTAAPHSNPDDERIDPPHFHEYHEGYDVKYAVHVPGAASVTDSLGVFCERINMPIPVVEGGVG